MYSQKVAEVKAVYTSRYEALKKQHDEFAEHVRKTLSAASTEPEFPESGPPPPFPDFARYAPPPQGFGGGGWGGGGNFDAPPRWNGPPPFIPGPPPPPSMMGRDGDRWGRGRGGEIPPYRPDEEFYDSRRGGPPMPYRGGPPPRDRYRRDGRFDDPYFNNHHHQDDRSYRGGFQQRRRCDESDYDKEEEGYHSRNVDNHPDTEDQQQVNTPSEEDLIPKVPFWQLPAALMHPLIGPKDFDFKPLDPGKLRLLAPEPPSERLMLALDAYYDQPSRDRPRDPEGWERSGLFEFYREKEEARNREDSETSATLTEGEGDDVKKKDDGDKKGGSTSPKYRGLPQLAYLTAYPKSAIGQAIRTGPAALIGVPPPSLSLPKMNAQFAAAAAAAAINASAGVGDFPAGLTKYPPPGMAPITPQSASTGQAQAPPTQLISRTSRFTSAPRRRSRSRSRSYSGSRSRSRSDSRSSRLVSSSVFVSIFYLKVHWLTALVSADRVLDHRPGRGLDLARVLLDHTVVHPLLIVVIEIDLDLLEAWTGR